MWAICTSAISGDTRGSRACSSALARTTAPRVVSDQVCVCGAFRPLAALMATAVADTVIDRGGVRPISTPSTK